MLTKTAEFTLDGVSPDIVVYVTASNITLSDKRFTLNLTVVPIVLMEGQILLI